MLILRGQSLRCGSGTVRVRAFGRVHACVCSGHACDTSGTSVRGWGEGEEGGNGEVRTENREGRLQCVSTCHCLFDSMTHHAPLSVWSAQVVRSSHLQQRALCGVGENSTGRSGNCSGAAFFLSSSSSTRERGFARGRLTCSRRRGDNTDVVPENTRGSRSKRIRYTDRLIVLLQTPNRQHTDVQPYSDPNSRAHMEPYEYMQRLAGYERRNDVASMRYVPALSQR